MQMKKHISLYDALKENIDEALFSNTKAKALIQLIDSYTDYMNENQYLNQAPVRHWIYLDMKK